MASHSTKQLNRAGIKLNKHKRYLKLQKMLHIKSDWLNLFKERERLSNKLASCLQCNLSFSVSEKLEHVPEVYYLYSEINEHALQHHLSAALQHKPLCFILTLFLPHPGHPPISPLMWFLSIKSSTLFRPSLCPPVQINWWHLNRGFLGLNLTAPDDWNRSSSMHLPAKHRTMWEVVVGNCLEKACAFKERLDELSWVISYSRSGPVLL